MRNMWTSRNGTKMTHNEPTGTVMTNADSTPMAMAMKSRTDTTTQSYTDTTTTHTLFKNVDCCSSRSLTYD